MRILTLVGLTCLTGLLGTVGACSSTSAPKTEAADLIGGVDAKSASLDAVGALLANVAPDQLQQICTGTLIAPRVVLTAKHCAVNKRIEATDGGSTFVDERVIDEYPIYFGIGADANAPTQRLVEVESVETCNLGDTGFMGLGCDVAVYHLKESVDDVRPLK